VAAKIPYDLQRVKDLYLSGLSAENIFKILKQGSTASLKKLIQRMKAGKESVNISKSEEAKRIAPSQGMSDIRLEATKNYTAKKANYTDELIEEIDTLTKNPKNKTIKQVETKLFKKFNTPEYNKTPTGVDSQNVFFKKDSKSFSIPRDYEIYGGPYGKKKVTENKTALKQIIGTKFFANNPNYSKVAGLLTAFYTDPDSEFNKKEIDSMRKFVKDFSITRSVKGDTIPFRFFNQLNFDFGKKIKDVGKIFNITEYLNEQIKNPKVSKADKAFYTQELNQLLENRKGLLSRLSDNYPSLFKYKVAPSGNLQFEHRVARALGETGDVKLPKDYMARGSYVPGRFNQAKYFNYDKPLMDLISEYNSVSKSEKPNIKLKIEELTKDFNTRSKGFLNNISFDFKDKVKMVDKTPLASTIKDSDLLLDLDKSINQSNAYFRSLGDQKLKGMPKGTVASDFIVTGKDYGLFKKLVNQVKKAPEACRKILNYRTGGISPTCEIAIAKNPKLAAAKLTGLDAKSGPLAEIKNTSKEIVNLFKSGQVKTADKLPRPDNAKLADTFKETNLRWNNDVGAFETTNGDIASQSDIKKYAADNPMEVKVGEEPVKAATNKSVLANVGKAMARVGAPLPTAILDSYFIGQQVKEGKGTAEIASNPLNWLGLATMEPLSKAAGIDKGGALNKALRLGLNPATIRGISRFAGLPGLAISTAMTAYDQYQKYKDGEGFIFNLLNQKGTE
jgi:hypothetical protein